jgi:hypothetical protein
MEPKRRFLSRLPGNVALMSRHPLFASTDALRGSFDHWKAVNHDRHHIQRSRRSGKPEVVERVPASILNALS